MENTYAWIAATADSNNMIPICSAIIRGIRGAVELIFSPSNAIRICPAVMLAINRTAKAPGRIILLIVSIKTINGIRIGGVPEGIVWASIIVVLLIHPNKIILNQIGNASARVKVICLDLVNT